MKIENFICPEASFWKHLLSSIKNMDTNSTNVKTSNEMHILLEEKKRYSVQHATSYVMLQGSR